MKRRQGFFFLKRILFRHLSQETCLQKPLHKGYSIADLSQRNPLLATFIFSLFLHIVIFSCFQIRIWLPKEIFSLSIPTTIALDSDLIEQPERKNPLSLFTMKESLEPSLDEKVYLLRMKGISSLENISFCAFSQFTPAFIEIVNTCQYIEEQQVAATDEKKSSITSLQLPPFIPWTSESEEIPSLHPFRIYPLKLNFYHGVKGLKLIDDASSLFTQATETTIQLTPLFAEIKPTVEFFIKIDRDTGKVSSSSCVKELVDKRLQNLSLSILKSIRFQIPENVDKKFLSGAISIQFNGNFDVIASRVAWDLLR